MKQFLVTAIFTLILAGVNTASAQCSKGLPSCVKSDAACPPCCEPGSCGSSCSKEVLAAKPWQGNVEINGKAYAASGKVYNTPQGTMASLSIASLQLNNEVFVVTKENEKRLVFKPKKNLGFATAVTDNFLKEL